MPAFVPVALRARADGWTAARQAAFLGLLAETGRVDEAARRVGMSRETAYRLRRRIGAESFAAAWDAVARRWGRSKKGRTGEDGARKVTPAELAQRAVFGLLQPMIWRGRYVGTRQKADNSALLRMLARLDRGG